MKRQYDLIFGLGNACSCTQTLREVGLQYLSFPFDWIVMSGADDLARRIDFIESGFAGWFEEKDLVKIRSYPEGNKDIYKNTATGTIFNHEFKMGEDLAARFPAIRAKYDRRIRRFLDLLKNSRRILILRMDRPDQVPPTAEADCRTALARLRALYPHAEFEMIHLAMADNISFADRRSDDLGDGLTRIAFDYRDTTPGAQPFAVRFAETGAAIAACAEVCDYRTPDERAAFTKAKRRQRQSRHAGETFCDRLRAILGFRVRRRYDLVLGVGNACTCSQALRRAKLQLLSFPFDWIVYNTEEGDLRHRADLFAEDFADWFKREDLQFKAHGEFRHKTDIYYNTRTRVIFNHDFPQGVPFEEAYDAALAKYRRRIDRMYNLIQASKRVLLVRLDRPDQKIPTPLADCRYLQRKMEDKFPGISFEILLVNMEPGKNLSDARLETFADGLLRIAFDYRSTNPNDMPTDINTDPARFLRKNFAVKDYRTREEKRAHRLGKRGQS